jgi:hypothetical protein
MGYFPVDRVAAHYLPLPARHRCLRGRRFDPPLPQGTGIARAAPRFPFGRTFTWARPRQLRVDDVGLDKTTTETNVTELLSRPAD